MAGRGARLLLTLIPVTVPNLGVYNLRPTLMPWRTELERAFNRGSEAGQRWDRKPYGVSGTITNQTVARPLELLASGPAAVWP